MSHVATNWLASVRPKDMTHGEFRVLFHLCDCHNPSMGCFPKQAYLMDHTGLSSSGLNKCLNQLEEKGLLSREQRRDPRTKRQDATHYILGFEAGKAQKPTPLSGDGADSTTVADPSPLLRGSVSTGVESYNKDKPVIEPVKEPCAGQAAAENQDFDFSGFCEDFMRIFPRVKSTWRTEDALQAALGEGHRASDILRGARAYADEQEGNETRFIAFAENWIADQRWESAKAKAPEGSQAQADRMAVLQRWADLIKQGKTWAVNQISPIMAREMIEADLVTKDECKALGVAF